MILSDDEATTQGSGRRTSGICLRAFIVWILLSCTACCPLSRQVVTQDLSGDPGKRSGVPSTQVYFYPKAGQSTEQQSRDHYECYNWAVQQTRFDPSQLPVSFEQRVRVVPMPPPRYDTAALAVAGAVLGALVAGPRHAAGGALVGAGLGAVAGAASDSARQESARQVEENYNQRDGTYDAQLEKKATGFRRAMSACLEGRGYSVQ